MLKSKPTKTSFATHLDRGDYDAVVPVGGTLLALAATLASLVVAI